MTDRSWIASAVGSAAHDALAKDLPASHVWSLLLDVLERRALARTPADLLRQIERDGFTQPSAVDQRTLDVTAKSGDKVPLIDGGAFDWVAKIASNRKLTYVASAIGTQLVALLFRR